MTPATEKAAPIPADVLALADVLSRCVLQNLRFTQPVIRDLVARAIMQDLADREARPSLPDIREAQIREEAAQDERDRLYRAGLRWPRDVCDFLEIEGAKRRARQGGNNG